jgi:putative flippase GtrA
VLTRLLALRQVRFLLSGGIVFIVSFSLTAGLHTAGLPFQLAFVIGYFIAVLVHLQLHRHFTFAGGGEYALGARHQAIRFVAVVVGQYAFIALAVAVLTPLTGLPSLVVYVGAIALMSAANFLLLASRVFHARHTGGAPAMQPDADLERPVPAGRV